jgi:polar amino acid transport system ATP-binding protein
VSLPFDEFSSNMNSILSIRDLTKLFGDNAVLKGVNLEVAVGAMTVIMGPSGCGKSTLLRCINRLIEPTSGVIEFNGQDITGSQTDVSWLRQQIGFVFQQFALFRHLTVLENVTLALRKLQGASRAQAKDRAMAELAKFGMAEFAAKFPAELSGGQQQRVAIARALAMNPKVLLMDEPTSALDPVKSREVAQLLIGLSQEGVTIISVTHDLNLAASLSDSITFIHEGRVHAQGSVMELAQRIDDPVIQNFFGRL